MGDTFAYIPQRNWDDEILELAADLESLNADVVAIAANTGVGFDDMQGDVQTALTGTAQWTVAQIQDSGFLIGWLTGGNQNDFVQQKFQFTHRKQLNTNVESIHLHGLLSANGVAGETIILNYAYVWVNPTDVIPALSGWTTNTKTITLDGTELANEMFIVPIVADIPPPANEHYSSILLLKITRISSGAEGDTFAGDLGVVYTDAHIKCYHFGSVSEY